MTKQDIFDLIACFDGSTAQTMKLSTQDLTIELTRGGVGGSAPSTPAAPAAAPVFAPAAPVQQEGTFVTAPLVGTFYNAPAPDQAPFVSVGDKVKKGQTLCLIEAMKMMSEIPAPCDCTVEEILKASGELVAFGEPLLRYRPC